MVVIVFSSSNEPTDLSGSYALGPYSYLVKSPTPDQLEDLPRAFKWFWLELNHFNDLAIFLAWQLSSCREEFLQLGGKTNLQPSSSLCLLHRTNRVPKSVLLSRGKLVPDQTTNAWTAGGDGRSFQLDLARIPRVIWPHRKRYSWLGEPIAPSDSQPTVELERFLVIRVSGRNNG